MDSDRMDAVIAEVNAFVAQQLWMDFSVRSSNGYMLEVSGSRDEYYWSELRVVFIGVCWSCIRFQGWKSDTGQPVLMRVDGPEAYEINARFDIEVGHHLFKFIAEDFTEPMWIAAQEIVADFTRIDRLKHGAEAEQSAAPDGDEVS